MDASLSKLRLGTLKTKDFRLADHMIICVIDKTENIHTISKPLALLLSFSSLLDSDYH